MENVKTLQKLFDENQLYLWVIEYGISHEVIKLAFHKGVFPNRIEVVGSGVKYFSGYLKGGPYNLAISLEQENLMIKSDNEELRIVFESIGKVKPIHGGY